VQPTSNFKGLGEAPDMNKMPHLTASCHPYGGIVPVQMGKNRKKHRKSILFNFNDIDIETFSPQALIVCAAIL
jgi:hypothetical protein